MIILPNAIDPERFKFNERARQEIRSRYGIAEDDFVIGHVGRFYPQKNHEFLIDVFNEVHKQKSNAKLLLLGDGPLQEQIRQKTKSLGLVESVIFVGLQKDPAPFYSAMDVFVFPSLWEGLGIVLLEAQYNGLPCIVSGAIPDEAAISNSFCLLNDFSSNKWCACILKFDFGSRNCAVQSSKYDINVSFNQLKEMYENV